MKLKSVSGSGPNLEDEWQLPAFHSLLRLQIFATPEAAAAANEAFNTLLKWGSAESRYITDCGHGDEALYDKAHERFTSILRRDLKIASSPH
jgi:hypothetical protein